VGILESGSAGLGFYQAGNLRAAFPVLRSDREKATAEVLSIISSSPGELAPIFEAILANAVRLCEAKFGNLFLHEEGTLRIVASHDVPAEFVEARRRRASYQGTPLDEVIVTKQTVHTADLAATQAYGERHPAVVEAVELGGIRTTVLVPMLKYNKVVGLIAIYRQDVRPFGDRQIELVKNFSAQAVIAIENTRLLNELRESLQQQTATVEVLHVISSSPGELEPVFQAMLENATRLCEASHGTLWLCEGDAFRTVALHGDLPGAYVEQRGTGILFRPSPNVPIARAVQTRSSVHIVDLREDRSYLDGELVPVTAVELAGIRTVLAIPMLKGREPVGAIAIYRTDVRPFTDKQIELVTNFAAQAVIAIENARLLSELRESPPALAPRRRWNRSGAFTTPARICSA
jgi:two-component system, NtrC family, sensor kinase